jgi:PAS domain S-box-containing protein
MEVSVPTSKRDESFRDMIKVMDRINCGLLASDERSHIAFLNERLLGWLGYTAKDVEGRPTESLIPPEVRDVMRAERAAARAGDIRVRLTILQRKDSTTFPVLLIPQRFRDDLGQDLGGFTLVVDLGAVETAKQAGFRAHDNVRGKLDRIARELQAIGLASSMSTATTVPLHHPDLKELTPRELEVLMLLVAGERVPSIAKQLFISQHTVRGHLKAMFRKVRVRNQSELVHRVRSLQD